MDRGWIQVKTDILNNLEISSILLACATAAGMADPSDRSYTDLICSCLMYTCSFTIFMMASSPSAAIKDSDAKGSPTPLINSAARFAAVLDDEDAAIRFKGGGPPELSTVVA